MYWSEEEQLYGQIEVSSKKFQKNFEEIFKIDILVAIITNKRHRMPDAEVSKMGPG